MDKTVKHCLISRGGRLFRRKAESGQRRLTMNMTEGRPLALLSVFALPLLIGNLFQQAYNLADSMIVGRMLGAGALAAVGATGSISFLFFSVFSGISGGCGIVTSKYFGAGQPEQVRRAIVNSAYITLVSSVLTGAAAFCMVPAVLSWMGTPPEILPDAVTYMRMTSLSVPLIAVYNYASSMQRALGDSRTPLYFLVVSCLLNAGLDLLFVGAFGLGVFGAALATMISQLLAGSGSLLYAFRRNPYFRPDRSILAFDRKIAGEAVRLGLPLALQWSLIAVSTTALQSVVNSFGATAVAAFTATNRLEQLVQQPFGSMSMALSTYSGQNMGAGDFQRIRRGLGMDAVDWSYGRLLLLAVATSIDALATGVIFIPVPERLKTGVWIIGIVSALFSILGYSIGAIIGKLKLNVELIGGLILIGIGIKIWVEGFWICS